MNGKEDLIQKESSTIEVSVIVPCYNEEEYVEDCLSSILNQSYGAFELFVINDGSTDKSVEVIKRVEDKRLVLIDLPNNRGIANARNEGVAKAKGEYLFFTDSDCIADKHWIQNGLKEIKTSGCLGLEGTTYYVSCGFKPTLSDKPPGDIEQGQQYMTCNIVYRREIISRLGGFDSTFIYQDDRELALRVLRYGKIGRTDAMKVTHRQKRWTARSFTLSARKIADKALLFKHYGERFEFRWRILRPLNLIKIVIPPLAVIKPILTGKVRSWEDFKLVPFIYPKLVYERLVIWKTALKEKMFII